MEDIGILKNIYNDARKKKNPSSTGKFLPGQGGRLTPQTYENWSKNVQGKPEVNALIDDLKRYNPPPEGGRNPTSDGMGSEELGMKSIDPRSTVRVDENLMEAPDVPMAIRQAKANSAQADVFKDMMANGGSGWIGGPQSGPGADPMGQSNDFDSRIQMGLFRNAAAGDEDTNLKVVGRGIGANMGNRSPQSLDMNALDEMYDQQFIDSMKKEGKSPEFIANWIEQKKKLGKYTPGGIRRKSLIKGNPHSRLKSQR